MGTKQLKKIPYGISDYSRLRQQNCYYVDKTRFLAELERIGDYLFFIRPRRFGKSLMLSMMAAYYDVLLKDRFYELFKGTTVYEHPTGEQGKYLVLTLNFSQVETGGNRLENSFLNHVRNLTVDFIQRYRDRLSANPGLDFFSETIEKGTSAADIFSSLMVLCRGAKQSIYLIIIDKNKNKPPTTNDNFSKLKQIIENGGTVSDIVDGFPLEEMTDANNLYSLLSCWNPIGQNTRN